VLFSSAPAALLSAALSLSCTLGHWTGGAGDSATPKSTTVGDSGTETTTGGGGPDSGARDSGDSGIGPPDPVLVVEEIGDQDPDLDSWIYDPLVIHDIAITLSDSAVGSLGTDPYTYVQGAVSFDGIAMPTIGVRLRGKIGSFRDLSGKPKFKLDFNQYISNQRFFGLETLSLNNSVVDCTYLKEPIAYGVMRDAGVAASRTSWAQVTVNGGDYGLYVMIETPDDRFLVRNFDDPTGNLYDGKYVYYDDGTYQLLDFATGDDALYQLEEGVDVDHEDITLISDTVWAWYGSDSFQDQLSLVVDFDNVHRMLAAEQWVGHNDGYALNTNNYRVYFDPIDGRMKFIPWDFDYSFLNDTDWGMSWWTPLGTIASGCWGDPNCFASQGLAMAELLDTLDVPAILNLFDTMAELTYDPMVADPRRECSYDYVMYYRDTLRTMIEGRDAALRSWWGL